MALMQRNRAKPSAALPFGNAGGLGNLGSLEVGLAATADTIAAAQRLRFAVFYEEMSAVADPDARASRRDRDRFDAVCDHLVVVDHDVESDGGPVVVATSRLLRQDVADRTIGFYSASEFDLTAMRARNPGRKILELGRQCVLAPYRTRRAAELMWHGIWRYFREHDLDVMIGCGSLEGTDVEVLAPLLALLRRRAPAPEAWRVRARGGDGIGLDALPNPGPPGENALMRALPPLIKGYLRLGAYVCEEAVIDRAFGTTDVFLVLPREAINARYIRYYGADADRYAA
jgi:putative hemolysin